MKPNSKTNLKPEDTFKPLVENAFDFLRKALEDFDKDEPKYSVIHFQAAIELILKARLMCEHWSLIISKTETANHEDFLSAKFKSVGIKEANNRLINIACDGLTGPECECFLNLSDHRNKLIHFYHQGLTKDKDEMEKIVAEQCNAWYHLHNVLVNRWGRYFSKFRKQIISIDKKMHKHREYLKTKYKNISPQIKASMERGYKFIKCPSCNFESLQEDESDKPFLTFGCLVCGFSQNGLIIDCPDCKAPIKFIGDGFEKCENCGRDFDPESLADALFDHAAAYMTIKDGEPYELGNCCYCDGFHTVVHYKDKYLCTGCLEVSDSIEYCQWCNEPNTGDMRGSYLNGCNHCDGKFGWDGDD